MLFRDLKIRTKITLVVLLVVIISVSAISYLSYIQTEQSVENKFSETFNVISNMRVNQIEQVFKRLDDNIKYISKSKPVVDKFKQLRYFPSFKDPSYFPIKRDLDKELFPKQVINGYTNIILTDTKGKVYYTSYRFPPSIIVGQRSSDFDLLVSQAKDRTYFGEPFILNKEVYMYVVSPLVKTRGRGMGHVIVLLNLNKNIFPFIENYTGLGDTGEYLLSYKKDGTVIFINPSRSGKTKRPPLFLITDDDPNNVAAQRAAKGDANDYGIDINENGVKTLAYWNFIPSVKWGLVVRMDYEEVKHGLDGLLLTFVQSSIIIILLSTLIAVIFSKYLTTPLVALRNQLNLVSKGILPENLTVSVADDEIGEMTKAVREVVGTMKRTASFAEDIGKGDYDTEFEPMSSDDTLGTALLTMKDSIYNAERKDKERTWIVSGVAEVGEILRIHNSLEDLGEEVIAFITQKIDAVQGAFYVVEDADNILNEEDIIIMKASYAYGKKKFMKAQFRFAEGLVGQAAIERDTILRTEIPGDYINVTSGLLGERKPKSILIVPLITNEKVFGVLEFAGFEKFSEMEVAFVEEISVIIARTIFNIKVNDRTVKLLGESQKMSEELKLQQDILRQNAEEMESTQEELQRTNHRLEDQMKEVINSQDRTRLLLENASEVITVFGEDGTISYASPSVKSILGYSAEEIVGQNGADFVHEDSLDTYKKFFNEVVEDTQNVIHTLQYEFKLKDGHTVWLEANGKNLLQDVAVQGIVFNAQNITERRRAEQEERMRTRMQALSENSLDLILRMNVEGIIYYVNPTIKTITDKSPELLLNKSYKHVELPLNLVKQWTEMLDEVKKSKEKCEREVEYVTLEGNKIMHVNGIPEFGEDNELESVLFVSHDITERKKAELEILMNNKKIKESINYAQRIQSAILPDNDVIRKELPNSFIFYQPRDVVSGDFPWFFKKGDILYLAAVDCTGHGVPGALISLIGYFILNDIISFSNNNLKAGNVLDQLHLGVTKTLRQDQNAKTRDGMDIAFLKINLAENVVEYAGAHRPLYLFNEQNTELKQIKGDRFPVGGGEFKTREPFSTTEIKLNKGDELYMFSDGLPDQFGGVDDRKFGAKKIRDIITLSRFDKIEKVGASIEEAFVEWKADGKQTDDVLMMGVKFD